MPGCGAMAYGPKGVAERTVSAMPDSVDDVSLSRAWAFVARLHAARSIHELQTVTHHGLLDLIPCDSVSFNWVAPGRLEATVHPQPSRAVLDHFEPMLAQRWRENPLAEHFRRTADARPLTWGDVTDVDEWRASAFFHDFYVPLGVWDQLGIRIPSRPGVVGGLVLNSRQAFKERDRAMLGLVGGHIALRLHVLGEASAHLDRRGSAGWNVVSVSHDRRVLAVGGETATDAGFREGQPLPEELRSLARLVPAGGTAPAANRTGGRDHPAGPVVAFMVAGWPGPDTVFLRAHGSVLRTRWIQTSWSRRTLATTGRGRAAAGRRSDQSADRLATGHQRRHGEEALPTDLRRPGGGQPRRSRGDARSDGRLIVARSVDHVTVTFFVACFARILRPSVSGGSLRPSRRVGIMKVTFKTPHLPPEDEAVLPQRQGQARLRVEPLQPRQRYVGTAQGATR